MWKTMQTIEAHRSLLAERAKATAALRTTKGTRTDANRMRLGRTALAN